MLPSFIIEEIRRRERERELTIIDAAVSLLARLALVLVELLMLDVI